MKSPILAAVRVGSAVFGVAALLAIPAGLGSGWLRLVAIGVLLGFVACLFGLLDCYLTDRARSRQADPYRDNMVRRAEYHRTRLPAGYKPRSR